MVKQLIVIIALFFITFYACSKIDRVTLEFRIAENEPAPGLTEMVFDPTGESFYLHKEVLINESDVDSAIVIVQAGRPAIELLLTAEGTSKFEELTTRNVGKKCGMVLNGQLVSAPIIRAPISVGRAIVAGNFTESEARSVAQGLNQQ